MTHVLVASDKFKGSLTAPEVTRHVATGLRRAVPGVRVTEMPIADGGEGTIDAAASAGFRRVPVRATGPTGEPVDTGYAERDGTAIVELADVSGLARLPGGRPDPLRASSLGTGELVRAALDAGCERVILGIGGSACTDGGAGLVKALGGVLLDAAGRELPPGGAALRQLAHLDLTGLDPRLSEVELVVACDVDNPLLGPSGAAAVYGPQKGAGVAEVAVLEAGLARWAEVVAATTGTDHTATPGAGAAGGVGFAAVAVLGASLLPGISLLLDVVGFPPAVAKADLVVTGEGSLDEQTLHGKAPVGVARAAKQAGVPVVAVAGRCTLSAEQLAGAGIDKAYALTDLEPDPVRCMAEADRLLERLAARLAAQHLAPASGTATR